MVSSAAVLFYFIGSFIPYKAKPFGGSHCSGVSLGNHARRVKSELSFRLLQRESTPSFVRI